MAFGAAVWDSSPSLPAREPSASLPPRGPQRDPMGPGAVKGGPPVGAARDGAERCPDPGLGSREVHAPPRVPHHLTLSSQAAGPLEDSFHPRSELSLVPHEIYQEPPAIRRGCEVRQTWRGRCAHSSKVPDDPLSFWGPRAVGDAEAQCPSRGAPSSVYTPKLSAGQMHSPPTPPSPTRISLLMQLRPSTFSASSCLNRHVWEGPPRQRAQQDGL